MTTDALACTGDPLLDLMLADCTAFTLRPAACETAADALREVERQKPHLLITSPALGDLSPFQALKGVRVLCLVEGGDLQPPTGMSHLAAERIQPHLVDAWVRAEPRPDQPRRERPARERMIPPPPPPPVQEMPQPAPPPPARVAPPPTPPPPARVTPQPGPATEAVRRSPRSPRLEAGPSRPALSILRQQVVTFWGGKPGAGRSTLAVALSDLLSRAYGIRICTVDLNPQNSSLGALVGKEQEVPSWFHLSAALAEGLAFPIEALRWVRPNWAILSGPDGRPDWVGSLTREAIAWIVEGLRTQFDYIILDPEVRLGPISETAVRLAQTVLVTVAADYADVLDTTRRFEAALEQAWLDRGRCRIILNRWVETPHLPATDVADCFALPVSLTVPASPEAVVQASSQGVPVTQLASPSARALAQALGPLVGLVAEPLAAAVPDRPASWWGWFGR